MTRHSDHTPPNSVTLSAEKFARIPIGQLLCVLSCLAACTWSYANLNFKVSKLVDDMADVKSLLKTGSVTSPSLTVNP